MTNFIDLLRASVRPVVTFIIVIFIALLTYKLVGKFGTEQMALMGFGSVLGTGATIIGFWFGGRKSK